MVTDTDTVDFEMLDAPATSELRAFGRSVEFVLEGDLEGGYLLIDAHVADVASLVEAALVQGQLRNLSSKLLAALRAGEVTIFAA